MDMTSLLSGIGIGAFLSAVIVFLALKAKTQTLAAQLDVKQAAEAKQAEIDRVTAEKLSALQADVVRLSSDCARFEAEAQASERAFNEARSKLSETFNALSADALRKNNAHFLELAQEAMKQFSAESKGDLEKRQQAIENLVKPINEQLDKVETQIVAMEKTREGAYVGLSEQVKSLMESQHRLDSQAKNLVAALKGTNTRGSWGEMQLRNLVEMAGMLNYCDFTQQTTVSTDDGRLRPDLVVRMPNSHQIIVDSKAPLGSYLEGQDEEDDTIRTVHLQKFASHVREHVKALSGKTYWDQFRSAEFVVMFLPGEPFLGAALRHDPELIEYSFKQKVILATPTTLLALLKTVAYGWRQEQVAKEAHRIAEEGRRLHKNIAEFLAHFVSVGSSLKKASAAYESAEKNMAGRMTNAAKKLEELGAKSAKSLPKGTDELDDDATGSVALIEAFENDALEAPGDESGLFGDAETVN